ncbi:hypothetical protein ACWOQH_002901 [Vibrio parahaemolyticus]|uniref:hypothetical protein n=1 Tax=Vibrio parahaemolyticus TaxID=670 RepID=UPI001ED918E4|nr:hypothetical protein [Vibrio parahaemolyticus]
MSIHDKKMSRLASVKHKKQISKPNACTVENGTAFDAELFKEQMTRGGGASEFLCLLVLSLRGYSAASSIKKLKTFTLADLQYKLDNSSRHQVISLVQMDMHEPLFQELEGIARKQLDI